MPDYHFIDLAHPEAACAALAGASRIGVDTEFMREKTYSAKLCLVQFAVGEEYWCADPLQATELDEFWDTLLAPGWVVHAGRQDFEVVLAAAGRLPTDVFDTQVAAALLGHAPQIGYANLVRELFGADLAKSQTRADWSRRPLSPEALSYAAEDVEWLLPAWETLARELDRRGRLGWAQEDSLALTDPALYASDPGQAVERVKAAKNLRGRARRAAEMLAAWRERRAEKSDKPRQWILRDNVLVEIAASDPRSTAALGAIDGLPAGTLRRSGDELLGLLRDAATGDDSYEPPGRPDEAQKALLKALQKRVAATAKELGIAAEVLAPRRELAAAAAGERNLRVFSGWRDGVVGRDLKRLLDS